MSKFRYTAIPPLKRDFNAIANEHFILSHRQNLATTASSHGEFILFSRCRNHWLTPIPIPLSDDSTIAIELIGFVDALTFRVLVHVYNPGAEEDVEDMDVVLIQLSESLEAASVVSTCRVRGVTDMEYYPLYKHNHRLLLTESQLAVTVFEMSGTSAVAKATFSVGLRCLFVTLYDNDIFLICKPSIDTYPNTQLPVLKSYSLVTQSLQEIPSYVPSPSWARPMNYYCMGFGSVDHLLITYQTYGEQSFFVYDLAARCPLYVVPARNYIPFDVQVVSTGEALMYNDDMAVIEAQWFKPPTLSELALRAIHCQLPAGTRMRLRQSAVHNPVQLIKFLLERKVAKAVRKGSQDRGVPTNRIS